ncbi:PAAR domain-containing protein [Acinetobacter sp. NIPH 1852]|uniref:PAAR domain-containing protein n=1 Tax=Acinetobacter sp. NIPH 1852 TaxID=2923428 RepID=UPI001B5C1690|nr:PAAR domain-containing protein [Acinetobacter sp. NIPH 1852]MBP8005767.1 PAAR domain-containing protein [Acinetobacter sp.]MCH7307550.1 PAAR domain-containing protein [Acinetobacter sp. NIPH 1852]
MATAYIVIGCPTTGGGKVISGSSFFLIEGIPLACVGDKATCPKHQTVATIITGDPNMQVMGKMAARVNDSLSCGCKLLPMQNLVVQDNGPSPGSNAAQNSFAPTSSVQKQDNFIAQNTDDHGIKFEFLNEKTGQPLVEHYFKITPPDGKVIEGFTDETGQTELVESGKEAKEVDLITFDLSKPMEKWS